MDSKFTWGSIGFLFKRTFTEFINDRIPKLSASLSYFTIFSLPPLLLIVIYLCGLFFGADAVRGAVFGQINGLVGNEVALQIQEMIKNVTLSHHSTLAATVGVITLMIGASGVFAEIQDSINFIWGLKAKPKKGLIKYLKNRLMSFSMIATMSFLLITGLMINSVMDIISFRMQHYFPQITVVLFQVLNEAGVFFIITSLFATIFRTLPDGKVAFKDSIIGASFTAILFMIGEFGISFYLANSEIATTYGVAGSVILLLLWVYYSAIILYFGAEFTKVYALSFGKKILPNKYAVYIDKEEVEVQPKVVNPD